MSLFSEVSCGSVCRTNAHDRPISIQHACYRTACVHTGSVCRCVPIPHHLMFLKSRPASQLVRNAFHSVLGRHAAPAYINIRQVVKIQYIQQPQATKQLHPGAPLAPPCALLLPRSSEQILRSGYFFLRAPFFLQLPACLLLLLLARAEAPAPSDRSSCHGRVKRNLEYCHWYQKTRMPRKNAE